MLHRGLYVSLSAFGVFCYCLCMVRARVYTTDAALLRESAQRHRKTRGFAGWFCTNVSFLPTSGCEISAEMQLHKSRDFVHKRNKDKRHTLVIVFESPKNTAAGLSPPVLPATDQQAKQVVQQRTSKRTSSLSTSAICRNRRMVLSSTHTLISPTSSSSAPQVGHPTSRRDR